MFGYRRGGDDNRESDADSANSATKHTTPQPAIPLRNVAMGYWVAVVAEAAEVALKTRLSIPCIQCLPWWNLHICGLCDKTSPRFSLPHPLAHLTILVCQNWKYNHYNIGNDNQAKLEMAIDYHAIKMIVYYHLHLKGSEYG